MAAKVFISYSHKDRKFLDHLKIHLAPLSEINAWDDSMISPGRPWKDEIQSSLAQAEIAILLVTPEFLASEFIVNSELPQLFHAAQTSGLTIVWIAVRSCTFESTLLSNFQAANQTSRPLLEIPRGYRDKALKEICEKLIKIAASRKSNGIASTSVISSADIKIDEPISSTKSDAPEIMTPRNADSFAIQEMELPEERRIYLDLLGNSLERWYQKPDRQRPPRVLVCGMRGVGKTTTIRTLFGTKVGEIGRFRTGTKKDTLYEWVSEGDSIHIIDLPGLGDSKKHDKAFEGMYRRNLKDADGVIVVVEAGKGALTPTVRTVELLLKCGVKPKLINFGFNKLRYLDYEIDGREYSVDLDPVHGPIKPGDRQAIQMAREIFLKDLTEKIREDIPRVRFSIDQIIEYDSRSGWNIEVLLRRLADQLPFETLLGFARTIGESERQRHARIKAATGSDPASPALDSVRKTVLGRFLLASVDLVKEVKDRIIRLFQ